jgi:nucleoside triphosphate diphosphatase
VVFHARIAEEAGFFDFSEVAAAIADKMVRRHPHVFGDAEIESAAAQTAAWEEHKANERAAKAAAAGTRESVLDGVALALPALLRAAKIQQRAARIGFDWPAAAPVIAKLGEEIAELEAEIGADDGDRARIEDEMGDILFAGANLARKLDIDPEAALRRATAKFERRFRRVEALAAERGLGPDLDALDAVWDEVKREENQFAAAPHPNPLPAGGEREGPTPQAWEREGHADLKLKPVIGALPAELVAMRNEARNEGYHMLDRLAAEWDAGTLRFDRPGEALFAAYANGELAGIGGITIEPTVPGALRMRRFYVRRPFRRLGIARRLALALLNRPEAARQTITVNAAAGSEPFWEALGFISDHRDGHTHMMRPEPG